MIQKSAFLVIGVGLLAIIGVIGGQAPLAVENPQEESALITETAGNPGGSLEARDPVEKNRPVLKPSMAKRTVYPKKDADYWFDKAALCATYGNNEAAIKYYQKAITLDPNRSGAYFGQGVAFGQMGDFKQALSLISKAIALKPNDGLYYYGRGRVYLMAADKENAMKDFKKAAELGDEDALNYLDTIARAK